MLNTAQKQTLIVFMLPYLCLATYDSWLHKRARRVPLSEQAFHAGLFLSFVSLGIGLFLDRPRMVLPAFSALVVSALADELGFHRALPRRERWLHFAAYACFALFMVAAIRFGALT